MTFSTFGIFLIAAFCIVVVSAIVILLVAIARSTSESDYAHDLQIYEEQMGIRRSPFTFVFDPSSGGYTLQPSLGGERKRMPVSESMASIQMSPSQPAIFGDEKYEDRSMKVMVTPPTPAKKEKYISLVGSGDIWGGGTMRCN